MTDWMVKQYSDYTDIHEYFKGYELTGGALKNIDVPTTMIIAEDDPIIAIDDFHALQLNNLTELIIHPYGGHNGFIDNYHFGSWYEQKLVDIFEANVRVC